MPNSHIKQIKLSAVRGINYFVSSDVGKYGPDANFDQMPHADTARINVFAGPNGAGKSTFLDTVRVLGDAKLLPTLQRSKLSPGLAYHSFQLRLDDTTVIDVQFEVQGSISLRRMTDTWNEEILNEGYPKLFGGRWNPQAQAAADKFFNECGIDVSYWPGPSRTIFDKDFFTELDNLSPYLTGIDRIAPAHNVGNANATATVNFTDEPGQSHLIQASELPSGWKAAAGLLSWMVQLNKDALCVIEEPETHLHPVLQRRVAVRLARMAKENNLQVFLSTHSPVFLNPSSWQVDDSELAIFHVDGKSVIHVDNRHIRYDKLLDHLGVKVSDLLQANCVIWVEGPSDRIYIRNWLEKWCEHYKRSIPTENVHYVFSFYGGSVLSHFDAGSSSQIEDAISMLKLNRKSFVVMDRDDDFKSCSESGAIIRTKSTSAKYRVVDALPQLVWITDGYTIESYLPQEYFDQGYVTKSGVDHIKIGTKLSKVDLARKFEKDHQGTVFPFLFGADSPTTHISRLYSFIQEANQGL